MYGSFALANAAAQAPNRIRNLISPQNFSLTFYQSLQAHPPPKRDLRQSQKSLERTIAEAQFAFNRICCSSLPIASSASTAKARFASIAKVARAYHC
jgi:hypothetical protein